MRRTAKNLWLLAGSVILAIPVSAPAAQRADLPARTATALKLAREALNSNNCSSVLQGMAPIIGDDDFAELPERVRGMALTMTAVCEGRAGQLVPALAHIRTVTTFAIAPDFAWTLRLSLETQAHDLTGAVTTLEEMQRIAPSALLQVKPDFFVYLNRTLKKAPDGASPRARLLALASDPAFGPGRYAPSFDLLRLDHARLLAASGDMAGAAAQVARIDSHVVLVEASVDPLLRAAIPQNYDMAAATRREIFALARLSAERSDLLSLVIAQAEAHRAVGEADKALALLESARPEGVLAAHFLDKDDKLNWWWDELASTYTQLGRYDDTVAALKSAIKAGENGGVNVSQLLNLASLQNRMGHPQDALETLGRIDITAEKKASSFGKMVFYRTRGCAAHRIGKTAEAKADLAYLTAHAKDGLSLLEDLQVCMGDADGAAATMIARLSDSDQQTDALIGLATYNEWPANLPPDPSDEARKRVIARADVQAAIARAGGTRTFNILPRSL
ncbi:tetratricopeptide repeat protein [Novosphingobium soli]|uniref:Tetratricopeptide repeat protein n=1 Tax=Novosphingobium soli TaxID=574956 RepID=A0ABV6CZ09_9SPHN